jgi:hypothetical protein
VAPKPKKPRVVRAYQVDYDMEGHSEIVFAGSTAEARRRQMNEWGCEFTDLSTKRRPELDDGVNVELWKYTNDWWWESCHYLECRAGKHHLSRDSGAYFCPEDHMVYCCQEHAALELQRVKEQKARIATGVARAKEIKPGIEVIEELCYENVLGDVLLEARLPSGRRITCTIGWLSSKEGQEA